MAGRKGRSGGQNRRLRETKILEGTWRADREPENLPQVKHTDPEMPAYLSERAAEIWDHLVAELGPRGRNILSSADGLSLAAACTSFAEYEAKPTAGREAQLRGWAALFGLSPRDRQAIPAVDPPKDDIEYVKPRPRSRDF